MSSPPPEPSRTKQRTKQQHAAKKITKEEKIFQLKSALKISKEENNRLAKENERLRRSSSSHSRDNSSTATSPQQQQQGDSHNGQHADSNADQKKFREAMRALKQVTVSQEKTIKTLRTKAQQRRKEIKDRDIRIAKLEQKVKSLQKAEAMIVAGGQGEIDLETKLKEFMVLYDEEKQKNNDLEEMLDLREAQMETVQKQRNSLLAPKLKRNMSEKSNRSSDNASLGSVSTNADFDVARLKTELAKKSQKINKLEMDLEIMRDELHEMKRKNQGSLASLGGVSASFFGQNSFHVGGGVGGEDDWTEVDTDCDSEYADSEFGNSQSFFNESDHASANGVGGSKTDAFGGDSFFKSKTAEEDAEFDFW
jgi:hypothetical protein